MSARLIEKTTGALIGDITDEDMQFLLDELEEESSHDHDYFIDAATVELLDANGGSPTMVAMLRLAVGSSEGIDIAWERRP
jgi:hypothetical protein